MYSKKSLCAILSKKFDMFYFLNFATNQKIAITRLAKATELQTMYLPSHSYIL